LADHPVYAALYDRMLRRAETHGLADRRRRLLATAEGRVLEIGAGTGLNLVHYHGIDSLTLLEPDAAMRRRLLERLGSSALPAAVQDAEVHETGIDEVTFDDASFDTIVSTLVLCTVPDLDRAIERVRRLLVPRGRLLFLEHVVATGWLGRAQRGAAPLWRRVVPGCHLDRDVTAALRRGGFGITDCERFTQPATARVAGFVVQGIARPRMAA
jgi:SAM-dependent methyltransferase